VILCFIFLYVCMNVCVSFLPVVIVEGSLKCVLGLILKIELFCK
jgi:hypothetical protein